MVCLSTGIAYSALERFAHARILFSVMGCAGSTASPPAAVDQSADKRVAPSYLADDSTLRYSVDADFESMMAEVRKAMQERDKAATTVSVWHRGKVARDTVCKLRMEKHTEAGTVEVQP